MEGFASLLVQQDFTGAVRLLDTEIEATSRQYDSALRKLLHLHVNRGLCNQKLQLNRKALKDFDAALALAPQDVKALLHKGQVLLALGKTDEAQQTWQAAATHADPTSDVDLVLQISQALESIGSSIAAAHAAAPAAAAGTASVLAPVSSGMDRAAVAAAPQPVKTAEAGIAAPHANGVIAPGQTSVTTAAPAAAPADSTGRESTAAAGGAAAAEKKQAPKAFKGFFKPVPGNKAPQSSSAAAAAPAAAAAGGGSSGDSKGSEAASTAATTTTSSSNDVVDIDCAAEQQQQHRKQQQRQQQRGAPVSIGEQIAQQQQNSVMLTIAINQINSGQVDAAEELLNKILAANPRDLSALVARGTARALKRDLKPAEADFTAAIQIEPRYPDTYKRRGQARSALGNMKGALDDLAQAAKLLEQAEQDGSAAVLRAQGGEDLRNSLADCYSERGLLLQKTKDFKRAAKELAKAVQADPSNAQAWNSLGLARVSMGDIRDGCKAYEKAIELVPDMVEAWLNLGQACKEEARVDEAERALTRALRNADGTPCLPAYRLLATMRQGAGRQPDAIVLLDKALGFKPQSIELLYLRAICYHALGYVRKAAADYEACMHVVQKPEESQGPLAEEARMYQYLSYYQRELSLWMGHNLDTRAADICLDTELAPAFKEGWCKKCFPDPKTFQTHRAQPPLPEEASSSNHGSNSSSKRSSSTATSPRSSNAGVSRSGSPNGAGPSSSSGGGCGGSSGGSGGSSGGPGQELPATAAYVQQVAAVTAAADAVGILLQNHHQGFLPNVRQQRAAGYAALQLAQTVRALLAERAAGREGLWVNSQGSSGEGGCSGRHLFGWRDAMDIVVKWRQLSEPADQVVWVDLLTKEEFENGFGSHTPMYTGQTKCVRYYMNFHRAMALAKDCLLQMGHAYDAQNREVPLGGEDKQDAVRGAKTGIELYRVIGQDSWVVVPLHSILKHQQKHTQAANGGPASANGGVVGDSHSSSISSGKANTSPPRGGSKGSSSNSKGKSSGGRNGGSSSSSSNSSGSKPGGMRGLGVQPVVVPDGCLEGTRLTLVKVPNQPDGVEFSIRTPVTPPRWKEFDAELEAAWEHIIDTLLSGDKHAIATAIMCYAYYWYNFMPLARGTAAVGYTTMLGLFWAAGMPVSQPIPKDYQVDWEAILAKHPQQFITRLSEWFVPKVALPCGPIPDGSTFGSNGSSRGAEAPATAAAVALSGNGTGSGGGSGGGAAGAPVLLPEVQSLPEVDQVLATFRQRLNALNGPDAKPV